MMYLKLKLKLSLCNSSDLMDNVDDGLTLQTEKKDDDVDDGFEIDDDDVFDCEDDGE